MTTKSYAGEQKIVYINVHKLVNHLTMFSCSSIYHYRSILETMVFCYGKGNRQTEVLNENKSLPFLDILLSYITIYQTNLNCERQKVQFIKSLICLNASSVDRKRRSAKCNQLNTSSVKCLSSK